MSRQAKRFGLPLGAGVLGAILLTALYLSIVSLAETPAHALQLFWEDKLLVIPIILGFAIQVGLYTLLKKGLIWPRHAPAGGATTAAGGGVSTMAMVACCAHHVADVLPLVGLTAAATFLANWKVPFMVAGLLTNLVGITYMVRTLLREHGRATAAVQLVPL
jgi:hypothetical protein